MNRSLKFGAALAVVCLLSLAAGPRVLGSASAGLWQVARSAKGAPEQEMCVSDPIHLAQWEHRGQQCSRVILSGDSDKAVIDYSCTGGGFGRSDITLLTPRTLRIATQGISGGAPFNYVVHARRVGNCATR